MSTVHKGLTVTVTLNEEKIPYVNGLLFEYRKDLNIYQEKYNKSLPGTFFISWLTLPVQTYAGREKLPARIILMSSYVGSKSKHIRELATFLAPQIKQVFSQSPEYPKNELDESGLVAFLKRKSIPNTFYSGFKFISTREVVREKQLKAEVWKYTRELADEAQPASPKEVKDNIESFVRKHPQLSWAGKKIPYTLRNKIQMLWPLGLFGLVMLSSLVSLVLCIFLDVLVLKILACIFPLFLLLLLLLFLLLRLNENIPHEPSQELSDEKVREIVALETNPVINEMTVIAPLKRGWIRRVFLGITLKLVGLVAYFAYIPTVHTARWLQMDKGKRLVFIANFDNLSEAYAHDFVDSERRSMNMAVIFSHAFGFPATRWLVHKQYNHRSNYMKGVRAHQKVTQFWYASQHDLSVENLKRNRAFREGLNKKMDDAAIKDWLLTL
ncbi:peroxidase [Cyclobacterium sp. SYSU L10401]|uniref:peroxidase n=1 Tax=Cyclobacterium sp. SYSU L10401 TaxID=2678657 RepID=UPI0013D64961|nr:peroxidase [Cyclobacterium sp. SYSU L10401]